MYRHTAQLALIVLNLAPYSEAISCTPFPPLTPPPVASFGVGFDLSLSYGTVAIAYGNGTTLPIAKIDGGEIYREMMKRLSLTTSETSQSVPFHYFHDKLKADSTKPAILPSWGSPNRLASKSVATGTKEGRVTCFERCWNSKHDDTSLEDPSFCV